MAIIPNVYSNPDPFPNRKPQEKYALEMSSRLQKSSDETDGHHDGTGFLSGGSTGEWNGGGAVAWLDGDTSSDWSWSGGWWAGSTSWADNWNNSGCWTLEQLAYIREGDKNSWETWGCNDGDIAGDWGWAVCDWGRSKLGEGLSMWRRPYRLKLEEQQRLPEMIV
jgi:hypothetical protein